MFLRFAFFFTISRFRFFFLVSARPIPFSRTFMTLFCFCFREIVSEYDLASFHNEDRKIVASLLNPQIHFQFC